MMFAHVACHQGHPNDILIISAPCEASRCTACGPWLIALSPAWSAFAFASIMLILLYEIAGTPILLFVFAHTDQAT